MVNRRKVLTSGIGLGSVLLLGSGADAATGAEIDAQVDQALQRLHRESPAAAALAEKAVGVLVFPNIVKGGLIIGGQYGEGALRKGGKTIGHYNTVAGSWGLQIGAQSYSQALYFMTDKALAYLDQSKGFDIGVDAGVAIADVGKGGTLSATTLQSPIIAFVYGQQGLMAGITLEGSKVTKIER